MDKEEEEQKEAGAGTGADEARRRGRGLTVTASTGSSTLRTCKTKRELGSTMRPPTIPPRADAQGSKVAHPDVITCNIMLRSHTKSKLVSVIICRHGCR